MRVLVLGDGKLGSEIIKQTDWNFLSRKKDSINISNFNNWSYLISGYDVVLNCIANTNTYSDDEESMISVNYKFVTELVNYCNDLNIKLVHISTDYVYANSFSDASEKDVALPDRNWYSVTKLLADEHIKLFSKDYLICRLSHKPFPFPYQNAWFDVETNADYTPVISDLVVRLVKGAANGVYNVGTETKTIFDLASKTNSSVLASVSPEYVPKNVTMDLTKLKNFLNGL